MEFEKSTLIELKKKFDSITNFEQTYFAVQTRK